jgi:HAD superfamily hydrolase (TIGR01509 family)
MGAFDAVLFDFGHTLFDTIAPETCIAQFRDASGVDVDPAVFASAWARIRQRSRQPDELEKGRDLSADAHKRCWLELLAPLDDLASGLAGFIYGFECSSRGWRPYPDTAAVLAELRRREMPVGVVSDCGWDIRAVFAAYEFEDLVDSFDLSYEHGACKPDHRLFESACATLGVEPARTLMVGDSWLTDGGAAAIGITALILPARDRTAFPALASVLELTRAVG